MPAVIATPELIEAAATDLATIGSTVNAAHLVAAAPTLSVLPAAADEVSAGIAHLFSVHAQDYQGLAGQAASFHEQFVQHLTASAVSYASAEAANVASLLKPLTPIVAPVAAAATAVQNVFSDLAAGVINILLTFSKSPLGLAISPYFGLLVTAAFPLFLPLFLPLIFLTIVYLTVFAPAFLMPGI